MKNSSPEDIDAQRPRAASPEAVDRSDGQPLGAKDWVFAAALLLALLFVYHPAWHGGFVFDDDLHLVDNAVLRPGGLAKAWTNRVGINYWPLTFTVYRIEYAFWGLNPVGYHIVNIVLHGVTALLLWRVLRRLQLPGAMFAAAIFAFHPVAVETVAWIAQLKGILSLMLAILSVLLHLRFEQRGGRWRLALAVFAFWLSALAKGIALTLPIVLLALAWWQRGRISRRDVLCVIPYVLVGALMAGVEVWMQSVVAIGEVVRSDSFLSRAAVAGCAVWFYLWKLVWPLDLVVVYPRWQIGHLDLPSCLPTVSLVVILGLAWWRRRSWGRAVVMLIVCYVGLLLPVLGFVDIYFMKYSLVTDHWQYAAMLVPCAFFAGVAATLGRSRFWGRPAAYLACAALLLALAALSSRQSRIYASPDAFYNTTIARNPACGVFYNNLGIVLADRGQYDAAFDHFEKALKIDPDNRKAHYNLGKLLLGRGQVDAAIACFQRALEISPKYAEPHNSLGIVLAGRGQVDAAMAHFQKAVEIRPDYVEALNNLGILLAGRGQVNEAIDLYQKALAFEPDYLEALLNLGIALAGRGQLDAAIRHYRRALEVNPDCAVAHFNLGIVQAGRGQIDAAIRHYQRALEINPNYMEAHLNLGGVLASCGQFDAAIAHFQKAVEIRPDFPQARQILTAAIAERERIRGMTSKGRGLPGLPPTSNAPPSDGGKGRRP